MGTLSDVGSTNETPGRAMRYFISRARGAGAHRSEGAAMSRLKANPVISSLKKLQNR